MRAAATIALLIVLTVCATAAVLLLGPVPLSDWMADPQASLLLTLGENPAPVALTRPDANALSPYAQIGRLIFFDPSLSASGQLSCASCHSPQHFFGPGSRAGDVWRARPGQPRRARRALADVFARPRRFSASGRTRRVMTQPRSPCRSWRRRPRLPPVPPKPRRPRRKVPPISCPKAGCSGMAGSTRCRPRRWGRCSTRLKWMAAACSVSPPHCGAAPYAGRFIRIDGPADF